MLSLPSANPSARQVCLSAGEMSMCGTWTEASNEMGAFCRKASAAVSSSLLRKNQLLSAWHGLSSAAYTAR